MNNQISSWNILKFFFQAFSFYNSIEISFSEKVRASNLDFLAKEDFLFDAFVEYLDSSEIILLRDKYLVGLRELSHAEFRGRKKMERFDIYISEIFHEVSILKEQKFILEHNFQLKEQINPELFIQMLVQTFELFETKMAHVKILFKNAKSRLEEILPAYRNDDFILRKLYLEGPMLLQNFYTDPVKNVLDLMFLEGGSAEGLVAIASSFSLGGFFEYSHKIIMDLNEEELKRLSPNVLKLYEKLKEFLIKHQSRDNLEVVYQRFLVEIKPEISLLKLV